MKTTAAQISNDLRLLRKINRSFEVYVEAQQRYEKKLLLLSLDSKEYTEVFNNIICLRNAINDFIKRATALENTYIIAIEKLEPLNKTIVISKFINCNSNWRIAEQLNYSLESINKRLPNIYKKLALIINKTENC